MKLTRFIVCLLCLCMLMPMTAFAEAGSDSDIYMEENFSAWREWAKFSYTVPDAYKDNIAALLGGERDDRAWVKVTDVVRCSETNDIFVSFEGTAYQQKYHIGGNAGPNYFYDDGRRCIAYPKFVIFDRETGDVLGYEGFSRKPFFGHSEYDDPDYGLVTRKEENFYIDLPDYFDSRKHKLMFYLEMKFESELDDEIMSVEEYEASGLATGYYVDDRFSGKYYHIYKSKYTMTEPMEIDVMQSTPCMDATGDGIINVQDAVFVLKHIAKRDVTIDMGKADANRDGVIDTSDVLLILKNIAGWKYEECPLYAEFEKSRIDFLVCYNRSIGFYKYSDYSREKYVKLFYGETPVSEVEEYIRNRVIELKYHDGFASSFDTVRGYFYNDTSATFAVHYLLHNGWTYKMVYNLINEAYYGTTAP